MKHTRLRTWALCSVCLWVACTPIDEDQPPLFNAIDPSLQCPTGKVGWDFSTGGFEGDITNQPQSNEIRITEATYGFTCGENVGNFTETFSRSCNGRRSCSRAAALGGEAPDPNIFSCPRDFRVRYTCGSEPTVYTRVYPASFGQNDNPLVALECGAQISIVTAVFNPPCQPNVQIDWSPLLAKKCGGLRRCAPESTLDALVGQQSNPFCKTEAKIVYRCGSDPTGKFVSMVGTDQVDFFCPAVESPVILPNTLTVTDATYGGNCGAPANNWLDKVTEACNGQVACSRKVMTATDTAPPVTNSCKRDLKLKYSCGVGENSQSLTIAGEAANASIELKCGEKISIQSATYGKNCNATAGNATRLFSTCTDSRRCRLEQATGNALFGSDPTPNCVKQWEINFTCGSSPELKSQTFAENDILDVQCPVVTPQVVLATGVRVNTATWGTNCTTFDPFASQIYASAANTCFGKATCDFVAPTRDPSPGCAKNLELTYHCGDDPEVFTTKVANASAGAHALLTCLPPVNVVAATYGGNCGRPTGNITAIVQQDCSGRRGQCDYVASGLGDPAPNCTKDLKIDFTCGPDQTVKTVSIAGESAGKTASLSCPVLTQPFARKACSPDKCTGKSKRDADLNCTADLTKRPLGIIQGYSMAAFKTADGVAATEFREDTAYDLQVLVNFTGPELAAQPFYVDLAETTIWASDTFQLNGGTRTTTGLRCVIGNVGLRRARATDLRNFPGVLPENALVGVINNSTIAPGCFGPNVSSWRDAAKRTAILESLFRTSWTRTGTTTTLSFDPQGRTNAIRRTGFNTDTALVPNPIGFFYTPSKLWVDFLSFYRQTEPETSKRVAPFLPATFIEATDIRLAGISAQVRKTELEVALFDPYQLPTLELDLTWRKDGDAPGRNPFSPTDVPLTPTVPTLTQRNLGVTVEITPRRNYLDARTTGQAWPSSGPNFMPIGRAQAIPLEKGQARGSVTRVLIDFPPVLRERLFRRDYDWAGWMYSDTEPSGEFMVRACMDVDGLGRSAGNDNDSTPLSVKRGSTTYTAGFVRTKRCVVADQIIVIRRVLEQRPFAPSRAEPATQGGRSLDQGNSLVATGNDIGNQSSCQRTCTVDMDCGAGQRCDGVATGRVGFCSGAGASNRCRNVDRNNMGATGVFGMSINSQKTTSQSDESDPNTAKASVGSSEEVLGYTVLDADDDQAEAKSWAADTKISLSLSPNWGLIVSLLRGSTLGAELSPFKPMFEKRKIKPRIDGLGVGIGRDFLFLVGPVPITISLSAGVGAGTALKFELEMKPDANYPCVGAAKCFQANSSLVDLKKAVSNCYENGGRLAELVSTTDWSGAMAAVNANATDSTPYWIGAQLAYTYPRPACANNPITCADEAITRLRWITQNIPFAEMYGRTNRLQNTSLYTNNYGAGSTYPSALSLVTTKVPNLAGVALTPTVGSLTSKEINPAVTAKYVCEFDPAAKARVTSYSIGATVGLAAGVTASICVPSVHAGLCVGVTLNFVSTEISFIKEHNETRLFRLDGSLLGSRAKEKFKIDWETAFLSGSIWAETRLVLLTFGWEIAHYGGVFSHTETLYSHEYPIRQSF